MRPGLRPNHNEANHNLDFTPDRFPISEQRLDGIATRAITRQQRRLEGQIGAVDQARLPDQADVPLYGYRVEVTDAAGTVQPINLPIDVDPVTHQPVNEDLEFFDRRNRAAILRSRSRSKGSASFNFAFRRHRGDGPGGHGYETDRVETEYHEALHDFVARKISADGHFNNANLVTQAVSRAIIQEQQQMSALENMAAEQKSGNRFMNFLRNHKKSRIVAGLALSGIGALGVATGQLEIAIPAFAARSALGATGGYLLGRTGWDAFQGWRARRAPHDDLRITGGDANDFSGRLTPAAAHNRFIKLHGAEARAGSHNNRREELIRTLGRGPVHQFITGELNFAPSRSRARIRDQVEAFYNNHVINLQADRNKSDQTQSIQRHRAALVASFVLGAMPFGRALGLLGGFYEIGGPGSSPTAPHHAVMRPSNPNVAHGSGISNGESSGTGESEKIFIIGNDTRVYLDTLPNLSVNGASVQHLNEALNGASTKVLHVENGGGFIDTLRDQYHLSTAQAETDYQAMYGQLLHHGTGTYMDGSDIRISNPGDFVLTSKEQTILDHQLQAQHMMSSPVSSASPTRIMSNLNKPAIIDMNAGSIAHVPHEVVTVDSRGAVIIDGAPDTSGHAAEIIVNGSSYVPEHSVPGMSSAQALHAQQTLENYISSNGLSGASPSAQSAAQEVIRNYAQAAIEGPVVPGTQADVNWIQHFLNGMHHNLSADDAETLDEKLAIVNASR